MRDARWVQRMATSVAGRGIDADDLAQDTWLEILSGRVDAARKDRGYLVGTLRNLARRTARSEGRRSARELQRDPLEVAAPSPEDLCLRVEAQQRIAAAALRLEDPLRSTVLLRFFEGVSIEEIASQHGVRKDTVRSRLRRSFELLKEDLDRDGGWRESFALAVPLSLPLGALSNSIPTAVPAAATSKLSLAAVTMWIKTPTLAVSLGLAALLGWTLSLAVSPVVSDQPNSLIDPSSTELSQLSVPRGAAKENDAVQADPRSSRTPAAAGPVTPAAPSELTPTSELAGTVTVVLPDGTSSSAASGSFTLVTQAKGRESNAVSPRIVQFQGGAWTATIPAESVWAAHSLITLSTGGARRALNNPRWTGSSDSS
ncbi:MAG: RNA polymerase sigma factor, partial [Planctomycetota bacterium]